MPETDENGLAGRVTVNVSLFVSPLMRFNNDRLDVSLGGVVVEGYALTTSFLD